MKRGRDALQEKEEHETNIRQSNLASALCAFRAEARVTGKDVPQRAAFDRLAAALRKTCSSNDNVDEVAVMGALIALHAAALQMDNATVIDVDKDACEGNMSAGSELPRLFAQVKQALRLQSHNYSSLIGRIEKEFALATAFQPAKSASEDQILPSFLLNRTPGTPAQFSCEICDLLVAHPIRLCIIMNFMVDVAWLKSVASELFKSDLVVLIHGMETEMMHAMLSVVFDAETRRRIVELRPRTPRYGTVHSKAVLSFCGAAGCRVVIHTANDEENDWELRAQGAWKRDFPQKSASVSKSSEFEQSLLEYFEAVQENVSHRIVEQFVLPEIKQYDFSSAGCFLVCSVPGKHRGQKRRAYGHAKLRALLEHEDIDDDGDDASVVIQFSSLGSIRQNWLETELKSSLFASASRRRAAVASARDVSVLKSSDRIELVLPTMEQMAHGHESWAAGRALPVTSRNVHREHIRNKLHVWCADGSHRSKAMPHIKTVLRYRRSCPWFIDWVLIGSANLSGAAWGWIGGSRGGSHDMIEILSYEMGVLLTPSRYCPPCHVVGESPARYFMPVEEKRKQNMESGDKYQFRACTAFSSCVSPELLCSHVGRRVVDIPVPYSLPPVPYAPHDIPWHADPGSSGCGEQRYRCAKAASSLGAILR